MLDLHFYHDTYTYLDCVEYKEGDDWVYGSMVSLISNNMLHSVLHDVINVTETSMDEIIKEYNKWKFQT